MRSNLGRLFEAKVTEVLVTRQEEMSNGAAKSFEQYRQQVGYLHGLRDALKLMDELEREPDERDTAA